MLELYIGNKNYSSWSLRPWLLMKHFAVPFEEHQVSLTGGRSNPALKPLSGNARVPCLHEDGFQVWESLAIAETLAERYPQMWPADPRARARARSISAEMHAGFARLRSAMPMNLQLKLKGRPADTELQSDIDRVVEIWQEARGGFAAGAGPYLFGGFSIADAMYAPVVWRFHSYNVPLPAVAAAYRDTMLAHPAMVAWHAAAIAESSGYLYDARLIEEYGGPR